MTCYYNDHEPYVAAWLRNLIAAGLIPNGDVDERSITEVRASDLDGYTQCHFFAGIGGWAYALQLAGWPDDRPVWTASLPCQPFSAAGKQQAQTDDRHLWPHFYRLVRERHPGCIAGEQVANAIGLGWLDGVCADLEAEGYAVGSVVLGAHSVGAPHIRQRLYFVAERVDDAASARRDGPGQGTETEARDDARLCGPECGRGHAGVADASGAGVRAGTGRDRGDDGSSRGGEGEGPERQRLRLDAGDDGAPVWLADTTDANGRRGERGEEKGVGENGERGRGPAVGGARGGLGHAPSGGCGISGDAARAGRGGHAVGASGAGCGLGHTDRAGRGELRGAVSVPQTVPPAERAGDPWVGAVWLPCRDGKARRIEPGLAPLVDGVPFRLADGRTVEGASRTGILRGLGNSIVPQVAAEFIRAYLEVRGGVASA